MCTPCALAGISALVNATRRPVADALSFLVCATLEGNGSRHPRFGVPLHVAAEAAEGSSASAPITPSSLRFIAADLNIAVSRELRSEPREPTVARDGGGLAEDSHQRDGDHCDEQQHDDDPEPRHAHPLPAPDTQESAPWPASSSPAD